MSTALPITSNKIRTSSEAKIEEKNEIARRTRTQSLSSSSNKRHSKFWSDFFAGFVGDNSDDFNLRSFALRPNKAKADQILDKDGKCIIENCSLDIKHEKDLKKTNDNQHDEDEVFLPKQKKMLSAICEETGCSGAQSSLSCDPVSVGCRDTIFVSEFGSGPSSG